MQVTVNFQTIRYSLIIFATHCPPKHSLIKDEYLDLFVHNEYDCKDVSPEQPTYRPTNLNIGPDLINFFIVKNISANCLNIDECENLYSGNSGILLTLMLNRHTVWESLKVSLEEKITLNICAFR